MGKERVPPGIFYRDQGGARRYYGRVDRRRVALVAPGETRATTSLKVAAALYRQLCEKHEKRQLRAVFDIPPEMPLKAAAAEHLKLKAASGKVTMQSLEADELHLVRATEFFGDGTLLDAITPQRVQQWITHLMTTPVSARRAESKRNGRAPRLMGAANARKHLNSLSNLCRRAQEQGWVASGWNPASSLLTKPTGGSHEAAWYETDVIALLLESARTLRRKRPDLALAGAYELVATAALTGARPSELLGLTAEDVSFDRGVITFRPNEHRALKTATSLRSVPLWPQLREVLHPYICPHDRTPRSGLLFPSPRTNGKLTDVRKMLDAVATRAGFRPRQVNLYAFRHSYCAARLQTLDRGAPVSPFTVGRELGHGGDALVRRVYGHLGETRHRAEVVEFRVEQHAAKLGDRIKTLRHDTVDDTVLRSDPSTQNPGVR